MPVKDLGFAKAKPQLARFYEQAHKEHLNYRCYIVPKLHNKFYRFEKRLYGLGINPREYAQSIVILLEAWAKAKRLEFIPVHTFLSDFALNVYTRVSERQYVRVIDQDEERAALALYGELILARYYIDSNARGERVSIKDAYQALKDLLPADWRDSAKRGKRPTDQECSHY